MSANGSPNKSNQSFVLPRPPPLQQKRAASEDLRGHISRKSARFICAVPNCCGGRSDDSNDSFVELFDMPTDARSRVNWTKAVPELAIVARPAQRKVCSRHFVAGRPTSAHPFPELELDGEQSTKTPVEHSAEAKTDISAEADKRDRLTSIPIRNSLQFEVRRSSNIGKKLVFLPKNGRNYKAFEFSVDFDAPIEIKIPEIKNEPQEETPEGLPPTTSQLQSRSTADAEPRKVVAIKVTPRPIQIPTSTVSETPKSKPKEGFIKVHAKAGAPISAETLGVEPKSPEPTSKTTTVAEKSDRFEVCAACRCDFPVLEQRLANMEGRLDSMMSMLQVLLTNEQDKRNETPKKELRRRRRKKRTEIGVLESLLNTQKSTPEEGMVKRTTAARKQTSSKTTAEKPTIK